MERVATLRLTLIRSTYDEAAFSPNYQRELRQFYHLARADHTRISAIAFSVPGVSADSGYTGEFVVPLSQEIGPVLARAALAWINSQAGRILRLTLGSLDFDLRTSSDFETLLKRAQTLLASWDPSTRSEKPTT
ncbi:hypothetical protein [Caballeronia sp. HLA56]